MAEMFDKLARAAGQVSRTKQDYQRERRRWEATESVSTPARSTTSSITSTTSSRSPASTTSASAATTTASPTCPAQLEDVSTYPLITQELLNRGYKAADIHKIMSGNILRVMRQAEKVAAELQVSGK